MPALQLSSKQQQPQNLQNGFSKSAKVLCDLDSNQNLNTDLNLVENKKRQLVIEEQNEEREIYENYRDVQEKLSGGGGDDDQPGIFGLEETSIGRSAKDQFAAALLRLQTDLDTTNGRLGELATKVEGIQSSSRRTQHQQQQQQQQRSSSILSRKNAETLFYLSWPVLVFFTIRGLERRYSSK